MNVLIAGDFCDRYRISDLIARGNYASLFDDINTSRSRQMSVS